MNPWQAAFQGWLERALYKRLHGTPGRYLSETAVIVFIMRDSDRGLAEEEKINIYINSQRAEVIHWKQQSDSDVSYRQWWFKRTIQINLSRETISLKTGSKVSMPFPKADTMIELYLHTKNTWPRRSFPLSIIFPFFRALKALNASSVLASTHNAYPPPRTQAQGSRGLQPHS